MGFLQGKKILITGIVSNRSIAYGIAKCCHREGAELAFSYANERFKDRVAGFAADFGSDFVLQMDVSNDEQINNTFAQIKERWGALDGLVHSIGFAPREAIAGDFLEGCTRDAFKTAMDISAYSFPAIARAAMPLMEGRAGSLLTLTYVLFRTTTQWVFAKRLLKQAPATLQVPLVLKESAPMLFLPAPSKH